MNTFLLSVIACLLLSTLGECISTLSGLPTDCGTAEVPRVQKEAVVYSKTQATPHSWPWQAGLWSRNRGDHPFCGGVLISSTLVLTSARCIRSLITCDDMIPGETFNFRNLTGDELTVHLGDHTFTKPDSALQSIQVELVEIHPKFKHDNEGISVDVALLKLSSAIRKTKEVNYICVPSADMGLSSKMVCYFSGWGAVLRKGASNQWKNARVLREAEVSVAECTSGGLSPSSGGMTCIEVEARSPCYGDEGGGLSCQLEGETRWYLNGILSNGDEKCVAESAATTGVGAFSRWLSEKIKAMEN